MEVHHHTHHPKKWKEYISEFLMLFFAVFLGFMSEYYLEYKAERHKEHDYLISLVEDLKEDTAEINFKYHAMDRVIYCGDRISQLIHKNSWTEEEIDTFYLNSLYITASDVAVNFSTGTVDQLKNAGGFRLIRNQEIVKKINKYEKDKNSMNTQKTAMLEKWGNVHKIQNTIIYFDVYNLPSENDHIGVNKKKLEEIAASTGSKFIKKDFFTMAEYSNEASVLRGYTTLYHLLAMKEKENAIELIQLIEKEIN